MFIVIDGPDGSGKTTLSKKLVEKWVSSNVQSIYTFEPTYDSQSGIEIRRLMRTKKIEDIYTFADLFVADRKEHLNTIIVPALARGENVVCDRYKYSALAYQQLQGVDSKYLVEINRDCLIPDYVFILLPQSVDVILKRILNRAKEREIFEEREFLTQTLAFYKKLPSYFPNENIIFLDAEIDLEENLKIINNIIGLQIKSQVEIDEP